MVKPNGEHSKPTVDADTEERVLEAAHRVFLRNGTHGARMQEIADEAGVNKALLHYYFRSKDRLAEAVFRRAAAQLFPRVFGILLSDAPIEEKVRRTIATQMDVLSRNPYLPAYVIGEVNQHPERLHQMLGGVGPEPLHQLGPRVLATLQAQLDAAAAAGTLRPIGAEQFLVNLLSLSIFPFAARPMLAGVLGLDEERFAAFIADRTQTLAAFFLNALRP